MVVDREVTKGERAPIDLDDDNMVEPVSKFPYLGSIIAVFGKVDLDIERRIAQASKDFGYLHKAVFRNRDLQMQTKRNIYQVCVLSVLLYE